MESIRLNKKIFITWIKNENVENSEWSMQKCLVNKWHIRMVALQQTKSWFSYFPTIKHTEILTSLCLISSDMHLTYIVRIIVGDNLLVILMAIHPFRLAARYWKVSAWL